MVEMPARLQQARLQVEAGTSRTRPFDAKMLCATEVFRRAYRLSRVAISDCESLGNWRGSRDMAAASGTMMIDQEVCQRAWLDQDRPPYLNSQIDAADDRLLPAPFEASHVFVESYTGTEPTTTTNARTRLWRSKNTPKIAGKPLSKRVYVQFRARSNNQKRAVKIPEKRT
jgi:hypothetical protein